MPKTTMNHGKMTTRKQLDIKELILDSLHDKGI